MHGTNIYELAFVYMPIYIYYTHMVNVRAHTAGITIKREI